MPVKTNISTISPRANRLTHGVRHNMFSTNELNKSNIIFRKLYDLIYRSKAETICIIWLEIEEYIVIDI